jgi:NADH dehydrogenase/NADH:ubiquinone oxidoreductase subunit G
MHCDCRKPDTCRLRILAGQLGAAQARFRIENRHPFERICTHPSVIYEPGKCIKCGICVRICEVSKEKLGLTFIGRGFQVRVGVPFSKPLSEGLAHTASKCIDACPTGALATP